MKNQKVLIIIFSLIIAISIALSIFFIIRKKTPTLNNNQDNLNVISNNDILKDSNIEELTISNGTITTENNLSSYSAMVTNNSEKDKHIDILNIIFTLGDEEIETIALIDTDIKVGEVRNIIINFDRDISKLTSISYELNKNEEVTE